MNAIIQESSFTFIVDNKDKVSKIFDLVSMKRGKKQRLIPSKFVILQIFDDSFSANNAGLENRADKESIILQGMFGGYNAFGQD